MLRYFQTAALLLCLTAIGCLSPNEALQKKDPDTVVKFASRKLDGKRPKTAWAKALETAFAQANKEDLLRIEELKLLGTLAAWEQIHGIHEGMERRHQRVEPLLPLVSEDGYRPDIRLLPVADMLAESRREVIELSLPVIEELLRNAHGGQRLQARAAYDRIAVLRKKYRWSDAQTDELQDEARALGTVYILLDYDNFAGFGGMQLVQNFDYHSSFGGGFWQSIDTRRSPGVRYDFEVDVDLLSASVSPTFIDSDKTTYTQEVETSRKAIKDTCGVVVGYDITYAKATATIERVSVRKEASLAATVQVYDAITGEPIRCDRIWSDDKFSEDYCTYTGDASVAAANGCSSKGSAAIPSDWQMLDNCASDFRFSFDCLLRNVDLEE